MKNIKLTAIPLRTVHPFPARMAPSIALEKLPKGKQHIILDPMAGSGTTLVTARLNGHRAIGFDVDPLAVLMARVWCSSINVDKTRLYFEQVVEKSIRTYKTIRADKAYPPHADHKTKKFIDFWFDTDNRKQLTALAKAITKVPDSNVKQILWCAFSRSIITKVSGVSLAMDVSHSRPHKKYDVAPVRAFDAIKKHFEIIIKNAPFQKENRLPEVEVMLGDARRLPLRNGSVGTVITSPPYLNAIDYLRGHKLALVWMGHNVDELKGIRSGSIGTEKVFSNSMKQNWALKILKKMKLSDAVPARTRNIILRYIIDMNGVISEISRVVRRNGRVIFVVGDSTLHGIFVKNSLVLIELSKQHSLKLTSTKKRPLPENRRYLPSPTFSKSGQALSKRMREEIILCFTCV